MTAAAAAAPIEQLFVNNVPSKQLVESPFHRRKDWGDLEELAGTIRSHGIVEPMLARPHPKKAGSFELVFGHRRRRAGLLAKLASFPVMVRDLTDEQAIELMAIENLARKDLHPLEEAEGYEDLRKLGWSAERIADRVGKSLSYVYQRMKLLALVPEARKAFYDEKILPSVAVYVARIPPQLQKEALEHLVSDWDGDSPMTARAAFDEIGRRFLLRLSDAPFDRGDAKLVPEAGSCKDCPKRTGNQQELFADVKSADVCTDPPCFEAKMKANAKRVLVDAAEKGKDVIAGDGAVSKALAGGYVDLDAKDYSRPKSPSYRELLKGKDVPTATAVRDDGRISTLVKRSELAKHVKTPKAKEDASVTSYNKDAKKRKESSARKKVATLALLEAVVAKAEKTDPTKGFWPFLARLLIRMSTVDQRAGIAKRRGLLEKRDAKRPGTDTEHRLRAHLEQLPPEGARALVVELAASQGAFAFGDWAGTELGEGLLEAVAFYKVDKERVKSAALDALKENKAEKKAKSAK
jgi:ParB/RepB/Spo0J family partition protein